MIPARALQGAEEFCRLCDDTFTVECEAAHHARLFDPEIDLHWEICERCRGEGKLRGYPGVYTSDDFAEDPDFAEEYMSYERPCEDCNGRGSVKGASDRFWEDPKIAAWLDDYYDSIDIQRQEMRYGA
jgi:hypothetical protein